MASGSPDYQARYVSSASASEQAKVSVTSSSTAMTFTQKMLSVIVYNDGANAVHINLNGTATTDNFKIPAKAWFMVDVPLTSLNLVCASGETATVYGFGVY